MAIPEIAEETRLSGADHRVLIAGREGAARSALRILLVASLAGLLFGAEPLRQWAEPVPMLGPAAAWWRGLVGRAHLDQPYEAVRAATRRLERS